MFLSTEIMVEGARKPVSVRVRNLSPGGMMIDAPSALAVDTRLSAEIRGLGEIAGRIAWHTAGRAGVAFDEEIDPKLARSGVVTPASGKQATPEFLKPVSGRRPGLSVR